MPSQGESAVRRPAASITAQDLEALLSHAVTEIHPEVDERALKAAINLKRAATILDQIELSELHSYTGRTSAAFRVLVMIWGFGPMEAKDVARLSGVSRQAVSSVLSTLERDGLVSRQRAAKADKRLVPITVTEAGAALVEEHLAPQNRLQGEFFSVLSPDELATFVSMLARLIVAAHPTH